MNGVPSLATKGTFMEYEVNVDVEGPPGENGDRLLLGSSSWNPDDKSLKYGWPDKNRKIARGGELPTWAIPQAIELAAETGFLDREQMARVAAAMIVQLGRTDVELAGRSAAQTRDDP
jgi:hypothetical protein